MSEIRSSRQDEIKKEKRVVLCCVDFLHVNCCVVSEFEFVAIRDGTIAVVLV